MKFLSIFIVPLLALSFNVQASDLKFYTEDSSPYNFREGNTVKGYAVDLLKETLKVSKIPITKDTIKIIPWARGIKLTQKKGLHNVLFTTVRVPPREKKWKWVGPIDKPVTFAIFAKKGSPQIADLKDVLKEKIAVVRKDVGEGTLLSKAKELKVKANLFPTNKKEQMIKLVKNGKVKYLCYEEWGVRFKIKKMGLNNEDFVKVHTLFSLDAYYAFNKSVSDSVAKKIQNSLDKVYKDKAFMKTLNKEYFE